MSGVVSVHVDMKKKNSFYEYNTILDLDSAGLVLARGVPGEHGLFFDGDELGRRIGNRGRMLCFKFESRCDSVLIVSEDL